MRVLVRLVGALCGLIVASTLVVPGSSSALESADREIESWPGVEIYVYDSGPGYARSGAVALGSASLIAAVSSTGSTSQRQTTVGRGYDSASDLVAPGPQPPLRQQYVDAVGGIDETISAMRSAGASSEDIARAAHGQRRAIGEQFKGLTPEPLRTQIFERNIQRYGDPLGPSVGWLRDAGTSWEEIIESAARTGGQDLGF